MAGCGLRVWYTNWRQRRGEIDIVAIDDDCVVFVEVKSRIERCGCADPCAAVDAEKQRRLRMLADAFIQRHRIDLRRRRIRRFRFDIIGVTLRRTADWLPWRIHIEHVRAAFPWEENWLW